jgi:hypothetical protein
MTAPASTHPTEPGERWRALPRPARIAISAVAALLLMGILGDSYSSLVGSQPGGPASSTTSTGGTGLSAWAQLLARQGREVIPSRDDLTTTDLRPGDTAVLASPGELDDAEVDRLVAFVDGGGTLVLLGGSTAPVIEAATGSSVDRTGGVGPVRPWVPVPELAGVAELAGDGGARWMPGSTLVGAAGGEDGAPFLLVGDVGSGRIVAVAEPDVVSNRLLDDGDNAAFALALVGPPDRPVVFLEAVHVGGGGGLAALPAGARWAGLGMIVALAVGVWAAAGRFGPPEPLVRALRPARREHVEAIAADLDRVVRQPGELVAGLSVDPEGSGPPVDADGALAIGRRAALHQRAHRVRHAPRSPVQPSADPSSAAAPPVATVPSDSSSPGAPP